MIDFARQIAVRYGWLIFAMVVGAILRFHDLEAESLWLDEWLSLESARKPLWSIIGPDAAMGTDPPFYIAILHVWIRLMGESEGSLRSPSVIFGVLSVGMIYGVGRLLGGQWVAALAAMMLAVSPLHVKYSQDARMYTLFTLLALMAMYSVAWITTRKSGDEDQRGVSSLDVRTRASRFVVPMYVWILYVVGAGASMLTHMTGLFVPIASNMVIALWWWPRRRETGTFVRRWTVAQFVCLLFPLSWAPAYLRQATVSVKIFWMESLTLDAVIDAVTTVYLPQYFWRLAMPAGLLILALALYGIWRSRGDRVRTYFLVGYWLLTPLMALIISLRRPIFLSRPLIWTSAALYVAVAMGVSSLPSKALRWLMAVAIIGIGLKGTMNYHSWYSNEPWDKVVHFVSDQTIEGDLVLHALEYRSAPYQYYFRGDLAKHLDAASNFTVQESDITRLKSIAAQHRRVFLVASYSMLVDPKHQITQTLAQLGSLKIDKEFKGTHGSIRVQVFEMHPPAARSEP